MKTYHIVYGDFDGKAFYKNNELEFTTKKSFKSSLRKIKKDKSIAYYEVIKSKIKIK